MPLDVISADPPYALDQATFEKNCFTYFLKKTLNEDGMMVIEHSKYKPS
jgi:16S rRNA G966 N2-methylase RsmD